MTQAITQVPLEVSTAGLAEAMPLTMQKCAKLLNRLDGEVQNPHVFLRSPSMRVRNLNFEIQPKI